MVLWFIGKSDTQYIIKAVGEERVKAFRGLFGQPKEKAPDSFKEDAKRCLERI